ncbi:NADH-cytochrome b5 reductase 1-like [Lycorma delicatula]|uniref:NADH-cytochrome b5 reductase 1-like n=1 Tax=Lycorma delicatula TaxID=130591 RepID=UPI003F5106D5
MEVLQAAEFLMFAIPTANTCPKITFELLTSSLIRAEVNEENKLFKLNGKVSWPGYTKTDENGTISIQLMKKTLGNWTQPVTTEELPKEFEKFKFYQKSIWQVEIKKIKHHTANVCELIIENKERVLNYFYPGRYVCITLRLKGKRSKAPFYPTIDFQHYNRTYPNDNPYELESAYKLLRILISDYGNKKSLQERICNRIPLNQSLHISAPRGGFCPSFISGINDINVLCESIGIGPSLSVILWTLQTNPFAKINLFYFNHKEKDIIYKKQVDEIAKKEADRLTVKYILKDPGKGWGGWKGSVELTFLQKLFPNWTSKVNEYGLIAGHRQFIFPISKWMIKDFNYPAKNIYRFLTA